MHFKLFVSHQIGAVPMLLYCQYHKSNKTAYIFKISELGTFANNPLAAQVYCNSGMFLVVLLQISRVAQKQVAQNCRDVMWLSRTEPCLGFE